LQDEELTFYLSMAKLSSLQTKQMPRVFYIKEHKIPIYIGRWHSWAIKDIRSSAIHNSDFLPKKIRVNHQISILITQGKNTETK